MEVVANTVEKTHEHARELLDTLKPDPHDATVVGFVGELGAGKTEFIRGMLRSAGITGPVTSPTYTIETIYELPDTEFTHAVHIDAYRLESGEDLQDVSFGERLEDPKKIILVEWARRVEEVLPHDTVWVDIQKDDRSRIITITNHE